MIVLSHLQAKRLWKAMEGLVGTASISPDLGLTEVEVDIGDEGVRFPDGLCLAWEAAKRIQEDEVGCYLIKEGELRKIQTFSEHTNRHIGLMPSEGLPPCSWLAFPCRAP
jgi:predicted methyltransferase